MRVLALGIALAAATCAGAPRAAPLEAYGRLPSMEDVSISPDGSRIAFVRAAEDDRFVAIRSLADAKPLGLLRIGTTKLRGLEWADDNRLMIVTSVTGVPQGLVGDDTEWSQLQVYDIIRKKSTAVPDTDRVTGHPDNLDELFHKGINADPDRLGELLHPINVIAGPIRVRSIQGHTILFFQTYCVLGRPVPALMRADLDTGEERVLRVGWSGQVGWSIDAEGKVVAEERYLEKSQQWSVHAARNGRMVGLTGGTASIDFPLLLGLGPAPETLLMAAGENGESVWKVLSLKDGSLGPPMTEARSPKKRIDERLTGRLIGSSRSGDYEQYAFLDAKMQAHWDAIVDAFKPDHVGLVSASDDLKKLVVLVNGSRFAYQYQLVDLGTDRASPLGLVYDGITEPLEVRHADYAAGDGLQIPAYLTLPRSRPAVNLALVVLAHGGPAERDTADFDWWSQALADQGYAVLRANYRGSTVDTRLLEAGFGQFGRKMQTDLSDGVRHLVKEGIVDPNRVCIAGASYGGYAALAGATLDPGVYRCAISVAGISDLKALLERFNGTFNGLHHESTLGQRYLDRFMGVTGPNDPLLEQISPIRHVEAVNAPILLIHGKDDTVVPYDQSDDMYDALRRANKTVEFIKLKHEDHWLSRSETRLQMLQATIAFLRKHNPPDQEAGR